jgi:maltose alpha-D-glucosyltransferase/alpha-amylase
MIRSFDYAAIAAVRQLAETRVAAEPRMTELAEAWRQRAVDGFRAAYRKAMRGCATYPASKRRARDMLVFFMLERAVHEVRTDLAQRPQWVDIPLRGLLSILNRFGAGAGGSVN